MQGPLINRRHGCAEKDGKTKLEQDLKKLTRSILEMMVGDILNLVRLLR